MGNKKAALYTFFLPFCLSAAATAPGAQGPGNGKQTTNEQIKPQPEASGGGESFYCPL